MSDVRERPELEGQVTMTSGRGIRYVKSANLENFRIDKTDLKPDHTDYLSKTVARQLLDHPWFRCELRGSASNDKAGLSDYNRSVARKRGEEVKKFLAKRRVSNRQVQLLEPVIGGDKNTQNDEDRSVNVEVVEPVNNGFDVRLVPAESLPINDARALAGELAFIIEDVENRLVCYFWFFRTLPVHRRRKVFPSGSPQSETMMTATALSLADFHQADVSVNPEADPSGRTLDVQFTLDAGKGFAIARRVPGSAEPLTLQSPESLVTGQLVKLIPPQGNITVPPVVFKV
jgi:hypothetical protein